MIWIAAALFIAVCSPAIAQETQMQSTRSTTWVGPAPGSMFVQSRSYTFEPLPDITPYELATAMKAILPFIAERRAFVTPPIEIIDNLPPEVKRHFRHHDPR